MSCKLCGFGEYSLINGMVATGCKKCPSAAQACHENLIEIKPGLKFIYKKTL